MTYDRVGVVITGIVIAVLGVFCLVAPWFVAESFTIMVGVGLLLAGISGILGWFGMREAGGGSAMLGFGVIAVILAVICLVHPLAMSATISWLIALCVLAMGIFRLISSMGSPFLFGTMRLAAVCSSIIVIIFGVAALAVPAMIIQFVGVSLVVEGVAEVIIAVINKGVSAAV